MSNFLESCYDPFYQNFLDEITQKSHTPHLESLHLVRLLAAAMTVNVCKSSAQAPGMLVPDTSTLELKFSNRILFFSTYYFFRFIYVYLYQNSDIIV